MAQCGVLSSGPGNQADFQGSKQPHRNRDRFLIERQKLTA